MSKTAINFALLAIIATGSASAQGYANVNAKAAKPLEKAELVQINGDAAFADADGNPAVRITDAGTAALAAHEAESKDSGVDVGGDAPKADAPAAKVKASFNIVSGAAIPAMVRAKREGGSSYPFDALELGQSFFIAATEDKKNPAKSMASTVTAANIRHSELIEGETTVNRKGNTVPARTQLRKFRVYPVADGAAWGHEGVKGAAVFRVELSDVSESDE